MDKKFLKIYFDIHSDWTGPAPSYRIYVNGELFVERTYIWTKSYLQEMLQISEEPDEDVEYSRTRVAFENLNLDTIKFTVNKHRIDIENLNPNTAKFSIGNQKTEYGSIEVDDTKYLEIKNESN